MIVAYGKNNMREQYEKEGFIKRDTVLHRKEVTGGCFAKGGPPDEKNILAGRGIASLRRDSFRNGNRAEVDRRLGPTSVNR
jgi:hypothetical protein